jgi:hypothetical protein
MPYTRTTWVDRQVQYPTRFTDELSNVKTFTASPGTIIEEGTLVDAAKLNNIEEYIALLEKEKNEIDGTTLNYTSGVLTSVSETVNSILFKLTTLTYTSGVLTLVNTKYYDTDGTTIIYNYNETLNYVSGVLTTITKVVL